jgi:high-affinity iron transporter
LFVAAFLIGLREGLEAALIVGILVAYVRKLGQRDAERRIMWGVGTATVLSLAFGALLTFGRYGLTFRAQEIFGGSLTIVAVVMVTGMIFFMLSMGRRMTKELREGVDRALGSGTGWGVFWLALLSVGREGIETTLMLWGWAGTPAAAGGAVTGIVIAVVIGWLLFRGMIRVRLSTFFAWSGGFLVVVAAGLLAYGIHDLQEAAVLPGPFSGAPITPTHPRTGEVLVGFTDYPFAMAAYPYGWAFDARDVVDPNGFLGALLKGTVGFVPQMTWLEVTAWALYLIVVVPRFVQHVRRSRRADAPRETSPDAASTGPTSAERTEARPDEHIPASPHATTRDVPPSTPTKEQLLHD